MKKLINQRMADWQCSRLEAIVSLNLGEHSAAAKRCIEKRTQRLELIKSGIDFCNACKIVKNNEKKF